MVNDVIYTSRDIHSVQQDYPKLQVRRRCGKKKRDKLVGEEAVRKEREEGQKGGAERERV